MKKMMNKDTKFEILDDLQDELVQDLQPEKHFAFLRSKRVLDADDCEEISARTTRRKKAELFLDILRTKGESGFDYFCESFIACGRTQLHLLNKIMDAYEDKIYENEVEPISRPQQDFVDVQILNEQLPRPGEAGAPGLPRQGSAYPPLFNGPSLQMNGDILPSYETQAPPPYSPS